MKYATVAALLTVIATIGLSEIAGAKTAIEHGYIALSTDRDTVQFFDTGNISTSKGSKYAWTLTVFIPPKSFFDRSAPVQKLYTKYGFNCRKSHMWQVYISYYDMAGSLLREDDTLHPPDEIVPASLDEKIFNAACKRDAKRATDVVIPNENSAVAFAQGSVAGRP